MDSWLAGRGLPVGATVLALAVILLSVLATLNAETAASLVLRPGHTILGDHAVWNVFTYAFVDQALPKLLLNVALVLFLGRRLEAPGGETPAAVVLMTTAAAVLAAGVFISFGGMISFSSTANEADLYAATSGTTPLLAALAVLLWQAHGDAPVHTSLAPALPASMLPLLVLALSAAQQYSFRWGRDAGATALATAAAWTFLRFFARHQRDPISGGTMVGDPRESFEAIAALPAPLRVVARPLEKAASALLLPIVTHVARATVGTPAAVQTLPTTAAAAGSYGAAAWGAGGSAAGAGAVPTSSYTYAGPGGAGSAPEGASIPLSGISADPVAERRREKALRALDKRLADMRQKLKGTSYAPAAPSTPPPGSGASAAGSSLGGPASAAASPAVVGPAAASAAAAAISAASPTLLMPSSATGGAAAATPGAADAPTEDGGVPAAPGT